MHVVFVSGGRWQAMHVQCKCLDVQAHVLGGISRLGPYIVSLEAEKPCSAKTRVYPCAPPPS